jgi:glycosyl transferase, family 25
VRELKQLIPVLVINLARATERRQSISHHLQELGVEFTFIDGVDGSSLDASYVNKIVAPEAKIHIGAIGCYLSHLACYEYMQKNQIPLALILEDDARLDPRVKQLLVKGATSTDFDYCFLDCDDHNNEGPIFYDENSAIQLGMPFRAFTLSAGPQTLHAYLITKPAATKRLEHSFPIRQSIDVYDQLPYRIHFRAIVAPKAAWVSEFSLVSSTSVKSGSINQLSFARFRKWPVFYKMRDFLRMKDFKRNRQIPQLIAEGKLLRGGKWKALPSGREILLS